MDLYENAPCGYVSLRPDGRIAKLNRTLADWIGTSAEALLGQSMHSLLSIGGRIAFETHLAPLLRLRGSVEEIALDLLCADGAKLPVMANAAEKRGAEGEHLFTRITLIKAVERRTYERNLVQAKARLEAAVTLEHEAAELREQFVAVLGHDLKNPLAALAAGIRMLDGRETLTERGRLITREMEASASRALALVENVLDFARGRLGGGLTLSRDAKEPLTPVLEQVVAEIRAIFPDREILTEFSIDEPVNCDRGRLAQLASNLVSNAMTYGAREEPVEIRASTNSGQFRLSVVNGGDAIPAEAQKRLFQPFFRGAVRRSQQGLGLGLFIVNEIATAHDGTMEVSSSDEVTAFVFSMPLADD